jgi:FtsP/CotA-like multicopper oxidase with cupredoxin domain
MCVCRYHAHHHGSVSLHTMGGMAGMLLVKPSSSDFVNSMGRQLRRLYSLKGYRNALTYNMVITHVFLGPSDPLAEVGDMALSSYPDLSNMYAGNTIDVNPVYHTGVRARAQLPVRAVMACQ